MPLNPLNKAKHAAAGALSGMATVLGGAASLVGRAAQQLRPDRSADDTPQTDTAEIVEIYESRGRVKDPVQVDVPDAPAHAAKPATHVEELAARPASEVIDAIGGLSTDELRQLTEHEQTHKRRKTVLAAIERAAAEHAGV